MERLYRLNFSDGSLLVEADFLESHSQVFRDLKEHYSKSPEEFNLIDFSLDHWKLYCDHQWTSGNFPLIDRLHLKVDGVLQLAMNEWQMTKQEIRSCVGQLSLQELQTHLPLLTSLDLDYGQKTLDAVVDLLGRSDEIFETNRVYLPTPMPDQFWARLDQFLGGTKWRPSPQVILSGGALMTLLSDRDLTAVGPEEDLDLWIYGPSKESRAEVRERLVAELTQGRPVTISEERRGTKITLRYQDGARVIQVLQTDYTVPSQMPNFFDLDHLKGYLGTEGLFLHPKFVRALRFNLIDVNFGTIKVRRLLKCLRYDYQLPNRAVLWKEVVKFLTLGLESSQVPYLPTSHNLWAIKSKLEHEITSKEQLVAFLQTNSGTVDIQTSYPLSIREKALIIAVDDMAPMQMVIMNKLEHQDVLAPIHFPSSLFLLSQPVVLRFHNLMVQKGARGIYYTSWANDSPDLRFLVDVSNALQWIQMLFKQKYGRFIDVVPLLRELPDRCSLNLPVDMLDRSVLTDRMRVDVDLQIDGIFMVFRIVKCHSQVIAMNVLEHL